MIEITKIKVKTYNDDFYTAVNQVLKTGMASSGKAFARKVRERTPVADAKYARAGKLRRYIRADQQATMSGQDVSTKIGSYARTKDKRKKSYGIFLEFGSSTTQPYGMFTKTIINDLDKIIQRHIINPLKKLKIKHS